MLKPMDIKTQKFKKTIFGYKGVDVDLFMDAVYRAYDELYTKNETLSTDMEKLNESLKESRLKIFDLEAKLQKAENVSSDDDDVEAKKKADQIIKNAEAAAAQIIAKAKEQSEKLENATSAKPVEDKKPTEEDKKSEDVKESASSKFFKDVDETSSASSVDDDDDGIFVGEIEDARKPDRMMIGDGEEEEEMDFEFL
ncbi:MAG: DivIVA domain-containing protein [Wujia sp.]